MQRVATGACFDDIAVAARTMHARELPRIVGERAQDGDIGSAERVTKALMGMLNRDIEGLRWVYVGARRSRDSAAHVV